MKTTFKMRLLKIIAYLAFLSWILLFVDGLFSQIQMFFFVGRIPIRPILKPLLLAAALAAFYLRGDTLPKKQLKLLIGFGFYIVFHAVYSIAVNGHDLRYLSHLYSGQYFFLILLPLFPSFSGLISSEVIIGVLKSLCIPLGVLGLCQHLFNATIIPPTSCDHYFNLANYAFYGSVRIFSFFAQLFSAGQYFILLGLLFFLLALKSATKRIFNLILSASLFFLVYATFTRTVYLAAIVSLLSLLFFGVSHRTPVFRKYLPAFYIIIGLLLVGTLTVNAVKKPGAKLQMESYSRQTGAILINLPLRISKKDQIPITTAIPDLLENECQGYRYFRLQSISQSSISQMPPLTSQYSFLMRLVQWKEYGCLGFRDVKSFLFGTGYMPSEYVNALKEFCIDNSYIDVFIQIGFAGLVLVCFIYWQFWLLILENTSFDPSPLKVSVLAMFSTLPIVGFFITGLSYYSILGILIFF